MVLSCVAREAVLSEELAGVEAALQVMKMMATVKRRTTHATRNPIA